MKPKKQRKMQRMRRYWRRHKARLLVYARAYKKRPRTCACGSWVEYPKGAEAICEECQKRQEYHEMRDARRLRCGYKSGGLTEYAIALPHGMPFERGHGFNPPNAATGTQCAGNGISEERDEAQKDPGSAFPLPGRFRMRNYRFGGRASKSSTTSFQVDRQGVRNKPW